MPLHAVDLSARLARECLIASDRLRSLQDDIGRNLSNGDVKPDVIRDVQVLDLLQQTLMDIGAAFEELATHAPSAFRDVDVSDAVMGVIQQETLRARLAGRTREDGGMDLEIF